MTYPELEPPPQGRYAQKSPGKKAEILLGIQPVSNTRRDSLASGGRQ